MEQLRLLWLKKRLLQRNNKLLLLQLKMWKLLLLQRKQWLPKKVEASTRN